MGVEFGFCLTDVHTVETQLEIIKRAEKLNFDFLAAYDHFFPWYYTGIEECPDPRPVLSAAAVLSERLKLGTGVTDVARFHPGILAQIFATIDKLSNGRVFVSIGAGEDVNAVPLALDFPSAAKRIEKVEEYVRMLRLLWDNPFKKIDYDGKYFKYRKAELYIKPIQKHLPVYASGMGPKAMGVVAKLINEFENVHWICPSVPPHIDALVKRLKKEIGEEKFNSINRMAQVPVVIGESDEEVIEGFSKTVYYASSPLSILGFDKRGDPDMLAKHAGVKLTMEEKPLVDIARKAAIVPIGYPDDVIKGTEEYIKEGINQPFWVTNSDNPLRALELLGEKVIPYLREEYSE